MPSKITPPKPWPAWGVPASVPSTLRVDLAEALSEFAGGWAKFRMSELERDVEGGRNAIWAEQLYWKSEVPGPLVSDLGREFETSVSSIPCRTVPMLGVLFQAALNCAPYRASGYRNFLNPGQLIASNEELLSTRWRGARRR